MKEIKEKIILQVARLNPLSREVKGTLTIDTEEKIKVKAQENRLRNNFSFCQQSGFAPSLRSVCFALTTGMQREVTREKQIFNLSIH